MSGASFAASEGVPFRFALLLSPRYLARRLAEIDSFAELLRRAGNLFVYASFVAREAFSARPAGGAPAAASAAFLRLAPGSGALSPDLASRVDEIAAAFRDARPFRHAVLDGFLSPSLAERLLVEFPRYDAERFRDERGHAGKASETRVRTLGPAFRELDDALASEDFLALMSRVTGVPGLRHDPDYYGGGTHENLDGMELDPHVDFTIHPRTGLRRRLNLMLYLNPEWDDAWGGSLELHSDAWNLDGRDEVVTITPVFNRCVIFETHDASWHAFRRIRLPADRRGLSRRAFALYLYHPEPAPGVPDIPADLTMFVDRPLPGWLAPGKVLDAEDVDALKYAVTRRDVRLRYLYKRALHHYAAARGPR